MGNRVDITARKRAEDQVRKLSLAMEQTGFLIATAATVAVALTLVLRIWRPVLILGLSLGLAAGIYLVFGKLLGVYLPHGRLIDLTF